MNAPPPGVVLICDSCRHIWEPTAEDWATGDTTCPDCGGWTMTAALNEPNLSHRRTREPSGGHGEGEFSVGLQQ